MAQACSVMGCNTRVRNSQNPGNIKFYRFPRDTFILERWKTALNINSIATKDRICNVHFTDSDYRLTNLGWKVLMPTAVPTLNLPDVANYQICEDSSTIKVDSEGGNRLTKFEKSNDSRGTSSGRTLKTAEGSKQNYLKSSMDEKSNSSNDSNDSNDSNVTNCSDTSNVNVHCRKYSQSNKDDLSCPHCNKQFASRLLLLLHLSVHYELNSYPCSQCEEKFVSPSELVKHKRECPGRPKEKLVKTRKETCPPFFCGQCGLTFRCRSQLQHHTDAISHSNSHCTSCDIVLSSNASLRRHVKSFHLASRFVCSKCDRLFGTFEAWTSHVEQHALAYECPECCKKFNGFVELDAHLMSHKSLHFYACNYCALLFSSVEAADAHMKLKIHMPSTFQCYFCKKGSIPAGQEVFRHYHNHHHFRGQKRPSGTIQAETASKKPQNDESPSHWPEPEIKIEVAHDTADEDLIVSIRGQTNSAYPSHPLTRKEIPENDVRNNASTSTKENREHLGNPDNSIENLDIKLKCEDCNKVLGSNSEMSLHQDLHKSRGDFSCIECGRQCCSSMALAEHYRDHVKCESDDSLSSIESV